VKVIESSLPGVLVIEPQIFRDGRGLFLECWNDRQFRMHTGVELRFVQDNHSRSTKGVLRGLHFQRTHPQGKLVRVSTGAVWDVVVDLRLSSPTFGKSFGLRLCGENQRQLWIPPGLAHGFLVLSDLADFQYKTTEYWIPEDEYALRWNDQTVAVQWPLDEIGNGAGDVSWPQLAQRDREAPLLSELLAAGLVYA